MCNMFLKNIHTYHYLTGHLPLQLNTGLLIQFFLYVLYRCPPLQSLHVSYLYVLVLLLPCLYATIWAVFILVVKVMLVEGGAGMVGSADKYHSAYALQTLREQHVVSLMRSSAVVHQIVLCIRTEGLIGLKDCVHWLWPTSQCTSWFKGASH